MKQKHTKYTQINTNKSMYSEMCPVSSVKIVKK